MSKVHTIATQTSTLLQYMCPRTLGLNKSETKASLAVYVTGDNSITRSQQERQNSNLLVFVLQRQNSGKMNLFTVFC